MFFIEFSLFFGYYEVLLPAFIKAAIKIKSADAKEIWSFNPLFFYGGFKMSFKCILISLAALCVVALCGCNEVAQDTTIFNRYYMTSLKVSTSADIIPMIKAEDELVTQGENAIAAWGDLRDGKVIWFNAVAFDDATSQAYRKYAFIANPEATRQSMRFDAELVINPNVINEPYANENARKVAILKSILTDFDSDITPLIKDSKTLNSSMLMVKQLMKGLIYQLDASPGLAANLENFSGMDFDHMNLGKGKTRMVIEDDVVKFKAMTGETVNDFHNRLDVAGM